MSDTVDLTFLSSQMTGLERELRLVRLQLENVTQRIAGIDGRTSLIEARLGGLEQSFHDLAAEMSRGFGQMQQQLTRLERRIDQVDAGLGAMHISNERTEKLLAEILAAVRPTA
jgi:septal ring factor EnvC (AmiA/AmiB activator)